MKRNDKMKLSKNNRNSKNIAKGIYCMISDTLFQQVFDPVPIIASKKIV